uniref:Uncharacterized protein n=1 Tax=Anguilla anguilla TaxID=7936 RepID=A0A0E9TP83_ANGAN
MQSLEKCVEHTLVLSVI